VMADLLISLARASVFNISLSAAPFQEKCDVSNSQKTASLGQTGASFVEQFAEAMKASLLSSNTQVQIRSLVLIHQVCPTSLDISEELHSLIQEGLTDYIFEVLRVSGTCFFDVFDSYSSPQNLLTRLSKSTANL
jgi:hypothetical protein